MNIYKLLAFLIVPVLSFSQEFKEKFSQDVCQCFSEKKDVEFNILEDCFMKNLNNYKSDIEKLIDENSELSEHEQGEILGEKIFYDMQVDLIRDCDSYYSFFNSLREKSILDMRQSYSESKLDSLNKELSINKTTELLWERGNAYFSRNELLKAKKDYETCLEMDPNHLQSIFFLGWVYEREKNYSKAIELYNQVFITTKTAEFNLIIEIAKRKSKS